jgi:enoyl-CoA hydratase
VNASFAPIERPQDHPSVRAAVEGSIGRLTLADPERRNALRIELALDLEAAVADALGGGAEVLVLGADPPVFCSGGDLDDLVAPRASLADIGRGAAALRTCPVPTIAMVDGPVIGAGITLALACDVIVCSDRASFDPRLLDLGVHPGGGQLRELSRRIGRQGAVALSLLGDVLSGTEAEARGLAWRCVAVDELESNALGWAERVVSRPSSAVRRAKATLDATIDASAEDAVRIEMDAQQWSMEQEWVPERVTRLRERLARRNEP